MDVIYFGCIGQAGHYAWDRGGRRRLSEWPKWSHGDGLFTPRGDVEGEALRHVVHGHTVIAFADRSVDKRPGSNSFFAVPGEMAFDQAVIEAKQAWPQVWERFSFEVRPVGPRDS